MTTIETLSKRVGKLETHSAPKFIIIYDGEEEQEAVPENLKGVPIIHLEGKRDDYD